MALHAASASLPAQSRSTWLPLGQSPADVEQALGQNGVSYVWALPISQGFRYAPM